MIHHYLQRGFKPEAIMNLSLIDKMFYRASMDVYLEEEAEKYKALVGE